MLDGSKAFKLAVQEAYGKRALIQRCIPHKLKGVLDYRTKTMHPEARCKLKARYKRHAALRPDQAREAHSTPPPGTGAGKRNSGTEPA